MDTGNLSENGNVAGANYVDSGIRSLSSVDVPYDKWIPLHVPGWRPSARYKHAAEVANGKLYVIGGSRNGRYLSDIQEFDLDSATWSQQQPQDSKFKSKKDEENLSLPSIAGHSLVKWGDQLLLVAGHSKEFSNTVAVWSVDVTTHKCCVLETHGDVPVARGGQSVNLVGSKLVLFGGEDNKRKLLNDLYILDLETLSWNISETRNKPPGPRSDHTAVTYEDRYLLIFGGSSHSICFNDLHILDLQNMEWSEIEAQGTEIRPRAGHASAAVGENWYIVGGGDNKSGATETVRLNMSKFVWESATTVSERDPLSSEGLSLCSVAIEEENFLLAFGGYNGKYQNEVFALKCKPMAYAPPRILRSSAAAAAAASVTAVYALTTVTPKMESVNTKEDNPKESEPKRIPSATAVDLTAASMEKKMLESKLLEVREENLRLRGDLNESTNTFKELSMELQSIQGQLEAEKIRCSKLEFQIAEIQKLLEAQKSIEHELEVLQQENSSRQRDMDEIKRQNTGVWQWMKGSS